MKSNLRAIALSGGIVVATAIAVHGQTGLLMKAVGGYSFEQAAKEAPETKNFHSRDGKLTFAIITHTAGNGFFDPTYVGAKVAADAFGINTGQALQETDTAAEVLHLDQRKKLAARLALAFP